MREVAPHDFYVVFRFFFLNLLHTLPNASQALISLPLNFIFEGGVLRKLFYLTDENTFLYLGLAYVWIFLP